MGLSGAGGPRPVQMKGKAGGEGEGEGKEISGSGRSSEPSAAAVACMDSSMPADPSNPSPLNPPNPLGGTGSSPDNRDVSWEAREIEAMSTPELGRDLQALYGHGPQVPAGFDAELLAAAEERLARAGRRVTPSGGRLWRPRRVGTGLAVAAGLALAVTVAFLTLPQGGRSSGTVEQGGTGGRHMSKAERADRPTAGASEDRLSSRNEPAGKPGLPGMPGTGGLYGEPSSGAPAAGASTATLSEAAPTGTPAGNAKFGAPPADHSAATLDAAGVPPAVASTPPPPSPAGAPAALNALSDQAPRKSAKSAAEAPAPDVVDALRLALVLKQAELNAPRQAGLPAWAAAARRDVNADGTIDQRDVSELLAQAVSLSRHPVTPDQLPSLATPAAPSVPTTPPPPTGTSAPQGGGR